MFTAALTAAVLLAAVAGFLVYVCRLLGAQPVDRVDAIRCVHCHRPKTRNAHGQEDPPHGRGLCVLTPAPPPPPVQPRLIEATYRKAAR